MRIAVAVLLLLSTLLACAPRCPAHVRYHDNGKLKSTVIVAPVQDLAAHPLPWDLSQELTEGIREHLVRTGEFLVAPVDVVQSISEEVGTIDVASRDLSYTDRFRPSDFVVLMEVIDHQEVPYTRGKFKPLYPVKGEVSTVLMITARLKVVDLRSEEPKVVLQEIVHSNHQVQTGKAIEFMDYANTGWGTNLYRSTPVGMAHARLERDVAVQATDYILFSQG